MVDHLLSIFSEDALGKSKWPIRDGFPEEGGRPTAHHRLKIPQEVLGLFPSYTHEVSCGEKLLQEQKGDGWGDLLKKIQAPFFRSSCWLASANPCVAHTGEPTKPVGAVLAGEKKKGLSLSR